MQHLTCDEIWCDGVNYITSIAKHQLPKLWVNSANSEIAVSIFDLGRCNVIELDPHWSQNGMFPYYGPRPGNSVWLHSEFTTFGHINYNYH